MTGRRSLATTSASSAHTRLFARPRSASRRCEGSVCAECHERGALGANQSGHGRGGMCCTLPCRPLVGGSPASCPQSTGGTLRGARALVVPALPATLMRVSVALSSENTARSAPFGRVVRQANVPRARCQWRAQPGCTGPHTCSRTFLPATAGSRFWSCTQPASAFGGAFSFRFLRAALLHTAALSDSGGRGG